jgi:hypothetical protein
MYHLVFFCLHHNDPANKSNNRREKVEGHKGRKEGRLADGGCHTVGMDGYRKVTAPLTLRLCLYLHEGKVGRHIHHESTQQDLPHACAQRRGGGTDYWESCGVGAAVAAVVLRLGQAGGNDQPPEGQQLVF